MGIEQIGNFQQDELSAENFRKSEEEKEECRKVENGQEESERIHSENTKNGEESKEEILELKNKVSNGNMYFMNTCFSYEDSKSIPPEFMEKYTKFQLCQKDGKLKEALEIYEKDKAEFEKTKEFREALAYAESKYIGGSYANEHGQENMDRIKKSIEEGNYEELFEVYKNRKGPQFEKQKAFKDAWEYLAKKYPQSSHEDRLKLKGREYMIAKEKNSARENIEFLKEKGYYEELLAMYYKEVEEEEAAEEGNKNINENKEKEQERKNRKDLNLEEQKRLEYLQQELGIKNHTEQESKQEQEKKELLTLISQEGGFRAMMSMPHNRKTHGSGFSMIGDEKSLNNGSIGADYQFYPRDNSKVLDVLSEKGLNEFAMIYEPLTKKEYETIDVKESSLFGLRKTTKQEERPIGEKQILHSELVRGGKDEACVPFRYYVFSQRGDEKKGHKWYDYMKGGRDGQQLELEVLLPKSTASKLQKLMNTDPIIVREIAEHFMKKKLTELYNGDVWEGKKPEEGSIDPNKTNYDFDHNNPLCPPWEKWDKEEGGGRIYMPANSTVVGWKDEFVKNVKKKGNS